MNMLKMFVLFLSFASFMANAGEDPLPSWNEGVAKSRIVDFVNEVSTIGNENFVAESERIAVFDNDGNLWSEQPIYFQLMFAIDRVKTLAPDHPEWHEQQPFKAVLENDMKALAGSGTQGLMTLIMATHANMTTDEFADVASQWIKEFKHPRFNRVLTDLVYQPMLEVLSYLRANGFETWIVSGGGIEFMRPWVEEVYGIPPNQVVGSSIKTHFEMRDGNPVLVRDPEIDFIDDKEGKPVGINKFIGRRPIAAFGNSDGDLQMLQWTAAGAGKTLSMVLHHTDAIREWAYDRESHIGRLDKALDIGRESNWLIVDMEKDWKVIYGFQTLEPTPQ